MPKELDVGEQKMDATSSESTLTNKNTNTTDDTGDQLAGVGTNNDSQISSLVVVDAIFSYLEDEKNHAKKRNCTVTIAKWLSQALERYQSLTDKYEVIYFLSEQLLSSKDADAIYHVFENKRNEKKHKPVLLVLYSFGGYTGNAYLIGKMLQELSNKQLEIAVPRQAKSAATLLCCAASHIHMGALSELGPIDPQMRDGPALGVKATIQHLAELAAQAKESIPLFVGYMTNTIDPLSVGYTERVTESSMQYAERLLKAAHEQWSDEKISGIAKRLTYEYKDHGFVIDKQECAEMFGEDVIMQYSQELQFADAVYKEFCFINTIANIGNYDFTIVGDWLGQTFYKRKQ